MRASPQQQFNHPGVRYRGLKPDLNPAYEIAYGACRSFKVNTGDLLTLTNVDGGIPALLLAMVDSYSDCAGG